jgi:cholera toxin transcriptional activator
MSPPTPEEPLPMSYQIHTHQSSRYLYFYPSNQRLSIQKSSAAESLDLGFATSRILELLISRADSIVLREELIDFAWPNRVVGSNSLNQAIASLREILGDEEKRLIIQTIPRHGYRLSSAFITQAPTQDSDANEAALFQPEITPLPQPIALTEAVTTPATQKIPWLNSPSSVQFLLYALITILAFSLLWRVDWRLITKPGLVSFDRQIGEQHQLFVATNTQALNTLENETAPISRRFSRLIETPTVIIFSKMHSFYSFICVDSGGASEFIIAHRSRLNEITDEQLKVCLE